MQASIQPWRPNALDQGVLGSIYRAASWRTCCMKGLMNETSRRALRGRRRCQQCGSCYAVGLDVMYGSGSPSLLRLGRSRLRLCLFRLMNLTSCSFLRNYLSVLESGCHAGFVTPSNERAQSSGRHLHIQTLSLCASPTNPSPPIQSNRNSPNKAPSSNLHNLHSLPTIPSHRSHHSLDRSVFPQNNSFQ